MNPLALLLILLIVLPLTEIYFLIEVGSVIGAVPTILLTIFTAVSGVAIIRIQGLQTIQKMNRMLQRQESPAVEIIEGVMLLIAAVCLLIPGFMTDTLGFILLIPVIYWPKTGWKKRISKL